MGGYRLSPSENCYTMFLLFCETDFIAFENTAAIAFIIEYVRNVNKTVQ